MSHIAFAFVPRKVASKHKTPASSTLQKGSKSHPRPLLPLTPAASTSKSTCPDTDLPLLLALSLSRYRLWVDPELRMDIERCTRVRSNDNFFPLSYILEPPSPLSTAEASEAAIAKALRAHAADTVDLRMAIPSAEQMHKRRAGSFEIRPRFWDNEEEYPTTRKDWDGPDGENLPAKCKTLAAACRFILGLLPSSSAEATSSKVTVEYTRMQNIVSPGSRSDDVSAEPPKLKSFALVTFKTVEDAESLLAAWPWKRLKAESVEGDEDKTAAARFGFRTCSKARWDDLNAEYVEYRAGLAGTEDMGRNLGDSEQVDDSRVNDEQPLALSSFLRPNIAPNVTPSPSYPPNCLVFIRNLDPAANKTSLRAFFADALGLGADHADEAIDYVDYTKGVDSCHLRLTSSTHANALVRHFTDKPIVQGAGEALVKAELVTGTREEVYWERVPEKVRMQAMKRMSGRELGQEENGSIGRERKRRKRH
ncbi:hypothetical protein C8F01DRAFT_2452, partial [Mycena amicta]